MEASRAPCQQSQLCVKRVEAQLPGGDRVEDDEQSVPCGSQRCTHWDACVAEIRPLADEGSPR